MMDIYILEEELKAKCHNSIDDFFKYVLLEMQNPIEDYYLAIELLKKEYPKTKDIRIAILGSYLSSTWLSGETNEFIKLLEKHLMEADNQNKAIIYYLLAYDIYMVYDQTFPANYCNLLQKSISCAQRFANNYIRLAEVSDSKEKGILLNKAISSVEKVWNEQELIGLSIDDFLSYQAFVDEFILGVSIGEDVYKELVYRKNSN